MRASKPRGDLVEGGSMKAARASMVAAGIALAAFSPARVEAEEPLNPMCEKLLPVTLVEKVTGAKGVKNLPPNPRKAAGGDCTTARTTII